MDSIPIVAITANVGVPLLGKDSFQEIDIAGVVMPITKHSMIVKRCHETGRYDSQSVSYCTVRPSGTGARGCDKRCHSFKSGIFLP